MVKKWFHDNREVFITSEGGTNSFVLCSDSGDKVARVVATNRNASIYADEFWPCVICAFAKESYCSLAECFPEPAEHECYLRRAHCLELCSNDKIVVAAMRIAERLVGEGETDE